MRKKLVFGGLVLLALVLTTGTFAYTYGTTGSTTINASFVDAAYNTVTPSGSPPNWNSVLPTITLLPQYLFPMSNGSLIQNDQFPASGSNWDKVDENSPDDSTTYVYTASKFDKTDLYGLTNVVTSINPIVGIKVHFRVQGNGTTGEATAAIETNSVVYYGTIETAPSGSWTDLSYEWTFNPNTANAWTETEVNALQAGVRLRKPSGGGDVECTQVYVEVEYQLTITQGAAPTGGLFEITPAPGFTGDLAVSIYLLNTEALIKAYQYLNLQVYLTDSVEAGQTPNYRPLTLNNGAATFTIEGGTASTYYLNVSGGGYAVISANTGTWEAGWSVTPEFYCEVSQR